MQKNRGGVYFPTQSTPDISKVKKLKSYKLNDILISNIRPYFKKIWKADADGTRSGDVLVFRSKSSLLLQDYLYIILQSDDFFHYMTSTSKGTKMPRGDKAAILDYNFKIPSISNQRMISNSILSIENKMKINTRINDNLVAI